MKKNNIKIEQAGSGYALYINDNYAGTYNKTILNTKLRAWNMPEIEL